MALIKLLKLDSARKDSEKKGNPQGDTEETAFDSDFAELPTLTKNGLSAKSSPKLNFRLLVKFGRKLSGISIT